MSPSRSLASSLRRLCLLALVVGLLATGCRVMPGSTSPSPATPPASASPGPATPPPPIAAAAAFFAAFGDAPPPYRVLLDVAIGGMSSGSAHIDADVAGAEYRADLRVELAGLPPRDSQIVVVGSTGYLREAEGDSWVSVPGYRSQPPLNPFLLIDAADFTDEGPDAARGGLHRLHSTAWVETDATLGYRDGGVRDVTFDVWLDAAGVPVEAELNFRLAGTDPNGQQVDLTYAARYVFSDVGQPITVEAPTS